MANLTKELSSLTGKRIVLCERDGVQQFFLRRILQKAGLVVVGVAKTGADTLLLVGQEQPDIVLLDTSLPDKNAEEVALAILEAHPLCLVLLTTDPNMDEQTQQLGASACLAKPFNSETLLSSLQYALAKESPNVRLPS